MNDIYKNIEECNPNKKCKILMVFDDMIADMLNNKNLNPIVTKFFIRGRKLNISIVFITQFYFAIPKCFIMKISNKRELNKLLLIINQILTLKTLLIFSKNVLQNHILF